MGHGVSWCFGTSLAPKERRGPIEPKQKATCGLRISSDHEDTQQDQSFTDADRGNTEQNLRESATSRNHGSDK
jgi:hypothetical protein